MQPKLEAYDISFSWDGRKVLSHISFSVEPGEMLCIVGRSGTGKTTLFHILAGLEIPDSGKVLIDGHDATGMPGRVSYMLQKDLLFQERKILDNVCLPLLIRGKNKKEARACAKGFFPQFGLSGFEDSYPSQLSGGMRQRAALLRTYLMDNDVVLLDEPFSALDAITRMELREWFLKMMGDLSLTGLLITHDVDEAIALGDKVAVLGNNPSTILSIEDIPVSHNDRKDFMLSDDALSIKRKLLLLLGA